MKKLLKSVFGAGLIVVTSLSIAGGCSKQYNYFQKHIANKESFLYVIEKNSKEWQATNQNVWSKLTDPDSDQSWQNQIEAGDYSPETLFRDPSSDLAVKYKNMQFYTLQLAEKDSLFNNKTVKKIIQYIVTQTEKHRSRTGYPVKNLTREKIGITGSPLFFFFAGGNYEGFFQGPIKIIVQNKTKETKGSYSMMYLIMQHIVRFDWMEQQKTVKN